jgi:predicted dehydrogenase
MNPRNSITRRSFLGRLVAGGAMAAAGPYLLSSPMFGGEPAVSKLNIGCIGMGGQMHSLVKELASLRQNIVAMCDVDAKRIETFRKEIGEPLAGAKVYKDFRDLIAQEKSIDAVVVATPDHWHALICKAVIQAGKHVYCEKPLTHLLAEAREIRELSRQSKVITQTGNQGSASSNIRRSIELIQAGVLGPVREVHAWHPPHGWPCGIDRPAGEDPIPEGFNWDFWIGPAPMRPYKAGVYHPGVWRGWYDFGGGSLADFCCHGFNLPVRALALDYPEKIEVSGKDMGKESFPTACKVRYRFPAREGRGPVTLTFYTGKDMMPPAEVTAGMRETFNNVPTTGCLLVGAKGTISAGLWNNECYLKMKDEPKFRGGDNHDAGKAVPKTLPRAQAHMREWVDACKGGPRTFSDFDIGGHITEIGLAGIVALRLGRDIEWDGSNMKVKGVAEADSMIRKEYRKKWLL